MGFSIRNREADRLARDIAKLTGETKSEAITRALRDRLERVRKEHPEVPSLADQLDEIALRCSKRPVIDRRLPDEILAYDENGLPR